MEALGISQRQLAVKLKTSQSLIGRLLTGKHAPSLETVEKIARALGCDATLTLKDR